MVLSPLRSFRTAYSHVKGTKSTSFLSHYIFASQGYLVHFVPFALFSQAKGTLVHFVPFALHIRKPRVRPLRSFRTRYSQAKGSKSNSFPSHCIFLSQGYYVHFVPFALHLCKPRILSPLRSFRTRYSQANGTKFTSFI